MRAARPGSNLTGERFGHWLVLGPARSLGGRRYWWCRCRCGETRCVQEDSLIYGHSQSCGCNRGKAASPPPPRQELPPSERQEYIAWLQSWRERRRQAEQERVARHEGRRT